MCSSSCCEGHYSNIFGIRLLTSPKRANSFWKLLLSQQWVNKNDYQYNIHACMWCIVPVANHCLTQCASSTINATRWLWNAGFCTTPLQVSSPSNISGLMNKSLYFTSMGFPPFQHKLAHTFFTWSFGEQSMHLRQPLREMHLVAGFLAWQRPVAINSSRKTCRYLLEGSQTCLCLW